MSRLCDGLQIVRVEKKRKGKSGLTTTGNPTDVVVVQPVRPLPGRWSVDDLNLPCFIAMLVPCVGFAWAVSNGRKASFSILKNEII